MVGYDPTKGAKEVVCMRPLTPDEIAQRDAFVERLLKSSAGVFDIFSIYLGEKLALYDALARGGLMTSSELAQRTATYERYIREWLEQQTVTGILTVENASFPALERRYALPAGHAEVLTDTESLNYLAPLAQLLAGATRPLDALVHAYQHGGGAPYSAYGEDLVEGQATMNRAMFLQLLPREWLPALPDVHARLQADPPARVADIGCGAGWSSIGMAQGYAKISVDGYDLDTVSIERAHAHAQEVGVGDRVTFRVHDASDPALAGQYDLVTAFECVHDMSRPVEALAAMRRLAGDRGAVLIVDERVGETFTAAGSGVEWMMYGWSILHCLPVGMTGESPMGTGTVMRPATLRRYAQEAGFQGMEILPIEHDFFCFYRLIL
jgi:2-polyprenyl-3-methyl-5-hydroxy-6-metoxy-1,4-benzoquinol methylase